jgi:hypothetical protein
MVKMSLLRPVLASMELARKARMARRQGLKPAKRPTAKTVATDVMVRSLRAFSEAHAGICESSLAKAGDKIQTIATASRIAVVQYHMASILDFLDGYLIVTENSALRSKCHTGYISSSLAFMAMITVLTLRRMAPAAGLSNIP